MPKCPKCKTSFRVPEDESPNEHVIAKGKDLAELWASVKSYRKVQKK